MSLKQLASKKDGVRYHDPALIYDEKQLEESIDALDGKLFVYDHFGVKDWEEVKSAMRYMVVAEGVKHVFLDPLTALISHLHVSEANDALNRIMSELSGMVHELDFTVYYFSHLNAPDKGPAHEEGGECLISQMTGSRAMGKWSDYIFMLEGNKSVELPEVERNTRWLVCRKDRPFGRVFKVTAVYNTTTGLLREPTVTVGAY